MPSTSRAQHNYMEMIAHDPAKAKEEGVSQKVAKDFVRADTGKDLKALPRHSDKAKARRMRKHGLISDAQAKKMGIE